LLVLAHDAWNSVIHAFNAQVDAAQLRGAYQHCARLTAQHSKSFYLSSALLPDAKRKATRALYAFCRIGDDLIDRSDSDPATAIRQWSTAGG
jgi:phytoene synthase